MMRIFSDLLPVIQNTGISANSEYAGAECNAYVVRNLYKQEWQSRKTLHSWKTGTT